MADKSALIRVLNTEIVECRKCARLVKYREKMAQEKRRAYRDWEYWGRPVPGFGDTQARLLILGLAPGAHGANRTGRMFTGDRSGDFLYAALYKARFANQPTSLHREDGLQLSGAYISATCRCAPPDNRPMLQEIEKCRNFLEREIEILKPKAVLALGKIAWEAYLEILKLRGVIESRARFKFAHGAEAKIATGTPRLFGVYHPSQQNTQTGRVTPKMYERVLHNIRRFLED
jgi:uracil-DNA glycosylase